MRVGVLFAGVPRGDTPGEGDGEGGPDGERERTGSTGVRPGVVGVPTSAGAVGGVSGGVTGVGSGGSPMTGSGTAPGSAAGVVGGTPKPPKGAIFVLICSVNDQRLEDHEALFTIGCFILHLFT